MGVEGVRGVFIGSLGSQGSLYWESGSQGSLIGSLGSQGSLY